MMYSLLVVFVLHSGVHANEVPCAQCTCYIGEDIQIADCESTELTTLPVFTQYMALGLQAIHLKNNAISHLDVKIIESWISLYYLDLRGNPLECFEFSLIDFGTVTVHTDCIPQTTSVTPLMTVSTERTESELQTTQHEISDSSVAMSTKIHKPTTYTTTANVISADTTTTEPIVISTNANIESTLQHRNATIQRETYTHENPYNSTTTEGKFHLFIFAYIYHS
jgi:hypothetical protein